LFFFLLRGAVLKQITTPLYNPPAPRPPRGGGGGA
jgi:hypothetical protein